MKISYADYIKKTNVSVLVAEAIFSELEHKYPLKKIGEIAETTSGGTPSRSNADYYNGDIPWLKSGELNDSEITEAEEFITEKGLANSSAKLHPEETLLLAMYGATAGKTGITKFKAATNQAVCAIFPSINVKRDYLFWFFRQHRHKFIEMSKGGAQPNISQSLIKETLLPLPDEETQDSIISILNQIQQSNNLELSIIPEEFKEKVVKVFFVKNSVSQLSAELTHQLDLVKQLRQAFLREAMQGKLTPSLSQESGQVETGQQLLAKIKAEKAQLIAAKKLKKEKDLPPIKPEEIPFEIPKHWTWCRLGEIAEEIVYGTSEKAFEEGEIPVLRMGNITTEGKILYSNLKYVSSEINDLPKLYLKNGDMVFNRTNSFELVGKTGIFEKNEPFTLASYLIRVRFLMAISSKFISNYINSSLCRATQLEPQIIQQNGQANFNGTKLGNIIIPLPAFSEQQRIVEKLESLMQTCDALEASIKDGQRQNEQLLQQVLREALRK